MADRSKETFLCSVEGCGEHDLESSGQPYSWCQRCEEFTICDKQDDEHNAATLYWEECREHHTGGYSICIDCAVKAYKTLKSEKDEEVKPGKEHCICPECHHDFGLLTDLLPS